MYPRRTFARHRRETTQHKQQQVLRRLIKRARVGNANRQTVASWCTTVSKRSNIGVVGGVQRWVVQIEGSANGRKQRGEAQHRRVATQTGRCYPVRILQRCVARKCRFQSISAHR